MIMIEATDGISFGSIVNVVRWDNVWDQIIKHYPEQKENKAGYMDVFGRLRQMVPISNNNNVLTVMIDMAKDINGNKFYHVLGLENGTRYAIDYMPWDEWLSFRVDVKLIAEMPLSEIVAHCLYEITWAGFTQKDVLESLNSLESFN